MTSLVLGVLVNMLQYHDTVDFVQDSETEDPHGDARSCCPHMNNAGGEKFRDALHHSAGRSDPPELHPCVGIHSCCLCRGHKAPVRHAMRKVASLC